MKHKFLFLITILLFAQGSIAQTIPLTSKLVMDPAVKQGVLPNGIKYYIRKNIEPQKRAQLRLVVKAGSILENDDQRGLAHFMEHMNFNGTTHFKKNELVNFLEKSGIKFGADLNAYTSFDETVYMLPIPTDTLQKVQKYFSVLSDWAANATLDSTEIEKERGVVLEESRLKKGAQKRIQEKLLPVMFRGSRYADRLPIGLDSIIEHAPKKSLKDFHKDWYRPDLEAVIAVGDFEVDAIEKIIKDQFGPLVNSSKKIRTEYSVPLKGGTDAVVITDPEQPYNMVQLFYLQPEQKQITGLDRKNAIIRQLFNSMINQRLQELLRQSDPPFLYGVSNYSGYLGNLDAFMVLAVAKNAEVEKSLTAVLTENERVRQFGFTASELSRAKDAMKTATDNQLKEKNKTESESYVSELVGCFTNDVVMTNIEFDAKFLNEYLQKITLNDVNDIIKKIVSTENRVLALIGSEKDKGALPSAEKLKTILDQPITNLKPYADDLSNKPLVAVKPKAGTIAEEKKYPSLGITEISYKNGVKVLLKPTTFKNDEIKFKATSWGGLSLYDDANIDNATYASEVGELSGVGPFNQTQFTKYMSGKLANVRAIVGPNSEAIIGSSNEKDFESALQIIYDRFLGTKLDSGAVNGSLSNDKSYFEGIEKSPSPEKVYSDTLQAVLGNYAYRAMPFSSKNISKISPSQSMKIFNDRFADMSDFVFTFVGNFDIEKIKPLLAQYLGGSVGKNKKESYIDRKILPMQGLVTKIVKKGSEDKATVNMIASGSFNGQAMEEMKINALSEILNIKLTERLREEESSVYSPRVSSSVTKHPSTRYQFKIGFGCSPKNVDKLINSTKEEIEKIKNQGPLQVDIEKYVNNQKLNLQTALKTNDFWLSEISSKNQNNEKLETILDKEKNLEMLNVANLQAAAKSYFNGQNIITAILLPEK